MRKRELKNVEWSLLIVAIILCTIGLVALFSATQSTDYDEFNKQCIWLIVSLVIMGAIMLIDYETLIKISPKLYNIGIDIATIAAVIIIYFLSIPAVININAVAIINAAAVP